MLLYFLMFGFLTSSTATAAVVSELAECELNFSRLIPQKERSFGSRFIELLSKKRREERKLIESLNAIKGEAAALVREVTGKLNRGEWSLVSPEFHQALEAIVGKIIDAEKLSPQSFVKVSELVLAYRDFNPKFWEGAIKRLNDRIRAEGIAGKDQRFSFSSALRDAEQSVEFEHILRNAPGIDPNSASYGLDAGKFGLNRARELIRAGEGNPSSIVDEKIPLTDLKAIRVAKLLSHARKLVKGQVDLTAHENRLADAYERTLLQERAKDPNIRELKNEDNVLYEEIERLFEEDPTGTRFVNRFLKEPGKYWSLVSEVALASSGTDTGNDRLFIHLPGVFRMTLEGEYSGKEGNDIGFEVIGYEAFVDNTGDFLNMKLDVVRGTDGKLKKYEWKEAEESVNCRSCHASTGELIGFVWYGTHTPKPMPIRY